MKILKRAQFGNPILREVARQLSDEEIKSPETQTLIEDMYHTLDKKKYGVGLAAPQVGQSVAIAAIGIKATPTRPDLKAEKLTIINPKIISYYGKRTGMWEGCISGTTIYAKAMRYKKVRMRWQDEMAHKHEQDFDGFMAHVLQHEIDHLNGALFVDRVKDPKTYMTIAEYKKRHKQRQKK
jgi:peptide deformylase